MKNATAQRPPYETGRDLRRAHPRERVRGCRIWLHTTVPVPEGFTLTGVTMWSCGYVWREAVKPAEAE